MVGFFFNEAVMTLGCLVTVNDMKECPFLCLLFRSLPSKTCWKSSSLGQMVLKLLLVYFD